MSDEIDEEDKDEEDEGLEIRLKDLVKNVDDKVETLGGTVPKSPIRIRLKVPSPTKNDRNEDENDDCSKPPGPSFDHMAVALIARASMQWD